MVTNTKTLFASLLKALQADCVCDIGSRDGDQSIFFRHLLPKATVVAFEANPVNYAMMKADSRLKLNRIDLFPYAISNQMGTATFHISDVDYSDPKENRGTSSLLVHDGLKIKDSVAVETHRVDEFLLGKCPAAKRIGLWIDVEGVEYAVLEGMEKIKDRVVAVHVETAKTPLRRGQKTFDQLQPLMNSYGFVLCGSNMSAESIWGDVVFIPRSAAAALGMRFPWCKLKAYAGTWFKIDHIAVFLKERWPWLYRVLRKIYVKLWT